MMSGNMQKQLDELREQNAKLQVKYDEEIKKLMKIVEEEGKAVATTTLTVGDLEGLPKDLHGSDLQVSVEVEDLTHDAESKDEREFKTQLVHATGDKVEWEGEKAFTFRIFDIKAKAIVTVNRPSRDGNDVVGDFEMSVCPIDLLYSRQDSEPRVKEEEFELRLKAVQLDDDEPVVVEMPKEGPPGAEQDGKSESKTAADSQQEGESESKMVADSQQEGTDDSEMAKQEEAAPNQNVDPKSEDNAKDETDIEDEGDSKEEGIQSGANEVAKEQDAAPAEESQPSEDAPKEAKSASASVPEPVGEKEVAIAPVPVSEGFTEVKCTMKMKLKFEPSNWMKQERVSKTLAQQKRNLNMIIAQLEAEVSRAGAKKQQDLAIATAAQKNRKGGAKKKSARKAPSRFDKAKQVFGKDQPTRERNYYFAKNVGIFVGAVLFISQYGEYMAV